MAAHKLYDFTEKQLINLYVYQEKSQQEIARIFGCTQGTVSEYMIKYNIKSRKLPNYDNILTKEFLEKEYIENKNSTVKIAKLVGCSHNVVSRFLHKHKIRIRWYNPKGIKIGETYGSAKVISCSGRDIYGAVHFDCVCKCGEKTNLPDSVLRYKQPTGCKKCLRSRKGKDSPLFQGCEEMSGAFWAGVKKGAKNRNLEFSIDKKYAWDLFVKQNRKCNLTGLDIFFSPKARKSSETTASLDRIDSSKGYIVGNVQWVHKQINIIKRDYDDDVFHDLCWHVVNYHTKKDKVLIFGGLGYLGCQISRLLVSNGYKVTIVDNFMYNQQSQVTGLLSTDNINFINHDVLDFDWSYKTVKEYDIVIPLAAIVGAPACDRQPELAKQINFEFIDGLSKNLSKNQLVLFPNSNSGYGKSDEICTENSEFNPLSLYGRTKCDAELAIRNHERSITLRLATVHGLSDRMRLDLLVNNLTLEAVMKEKLKIFQPQFRRNFIHVKDIARCFLHCISNQDKMVGECYNVGCDENNMTKKRLAETIAEITGCEVSFSDDKEDPDKRDYIISSQKLYDTGFMTVKTVADGVKELLPLLSSLKKYSKDELKAMTSSMYNY